MSSGEEAGVNAFQMQPNQVPDTRPPEVIAARSSRGSNEAEHGTLAPHFRLLEIGGGNRPVESGA